MTFAFNMTSRLSNLQHAPRTLLRQFVGFALCALSVLVSPSAFASDTTIAASAALWRPVEETSIQFAGQRPMVPLAYQTMRLNQQALSDLLVRAPMEFSDAARIAAPIITLPMPDGTLARFSFEESPIMEPALAAQYPDWKTYRAQGIDDPTATARFDWLPSGFHAMVLAPSGTVFIDPYADGNQTDYATYWKRDAALSKNAFTCSVHGDAELKSAFSGNGISPTTTSGTTLRTYRLALAATGEYTAVVGGTVSAALAAQVLIMNRVNGVYERNLAIRMVLVANNNLLIYTNAATDPYTNDDGNAMLAQNQTNIDAVIGNANYDIGHVFSTGGGGIAGLRVPCSTGNKARGVTGLTNPTGDAFAIDYVAHEMGHQWGGNHTFNTTAGFCGGNRASAAAYEPGSGITIMAYAGICDAQDLASNSIDTFHVKSLEEIISYSQTSTGNTCGTQTATGNTAPVVTGPGNFTIPKGTPFALTASATDVNSDVLTYDWQEYDLGAATTAAPNTDASGGARPIFRPYSPTTSGTRTFPSMQYVLNNANVPPTTTGGFLTGELLPAIARTMNFQVVVRDNRANGGGMTTATSAVTVDAASGPFVVTAPNTAVSVAGGSTLNVTWNVAGTTAAPVSAANVKISLSTDGGITFPTVLLASTPNDGAQTVTVPNVATTAARIKVEAVGNIFFDISDANFTITASVAGPLDVDLSIGATRYDAATDGLLVLRHMFGLTGTALTTNALGGTATRTDPVIIRNYLIGLGTALDIDGDGNIDALTDGLLILRHLLGLSGSALTAGAANPVGARSIAGTIGSYLTTLTTP